MLYSPALLHHMPMSAFGKEPRCHKHTLRSHPASTCPHYSAGEAGAYKVYRDAHCTTALIQVACNHQTGDQLWQHQGFVGVAGPRRCQVQCLVHYRITTPLQTAAGEQPRLRTGQGNADAYLSICTIGEVQYTEMLCCINGVTWGRSAMVKLRSVDQLGPRKVTIQR